MWKQAEDGTYEPDGQPFDKPQDSFERVYNHRLKVDPEAVEAGVFDPYHGFPVSMRSHTDKPDSAETLRAQLDLFFDPAYQKACLDAGNTPKELDTLAKRLLAFAVMLDCPITDRERNVAERLGVKVADLTRHVETPRGTVY